MVPRNRKCTVPGTLLEVVIQYQSTLLALFIQYASTEVLIQYATGGCHIPGTWQCASGLIVQYATEVSRQYATGVSPQYATSINRYDYFVYLNKSRV